MDKIRIITEKDYTSFFPQITPITLKKYPDIQQERELICYSLYHNWLLMYISNKLQLKKYDDLMCDSEVFQKAVDYLEKNPNVDSILGDLTIIDEFSNVTGIQKVLPYLNKKRIPAIQLLWLGRNLYVDMAFHRKEAFIDTVYRNYLVWDKPFWIFFKIIYCFLKYFTITH